METVIEFGIIGLEVLGFLYLLKLINNIKEKK